MKLNLLDHYQRLFFNDTVIYTNPEKPDWFIANEKTDVFLRKIYEKKSVLEATLEFSRIVGDDFDHALHEIRHFLSRIDNVSYDEYKGRSHYRKLNHLKECWFHITNQCNTNCGHCMFSSNSRSQTSLSLDDLLRTAEEAFELGCKVFYFTGGEPLIYKGFTSICDEILHKKGTHIVILSNGKDLIRFDQWLKSAPIDRIHFQLSIDGSEKNHDDLRGKGEFKELMNNLTYLEGLGFPITLAMLVNKKNVRGMNSLVDIAYSEGIKNIHYLWLFKKGKVNEKLFVSPREIFKELIKAYEKGIKKGISIDNFEIIKSQIFSLPGTRFDLSNAAWESLAVGPEGNIYPSPALVFEKELIAGHISDGLENVWRKSPVFKSIRRASLIEDEKNKKNPLKYLVGGGDMDHSYVAGKTFTGNDPYMEIYNQMVLYLLYREAGSYKENGHLGIICRMGERLYECNEDSASVGFTHSNCVLSLPGKDGYSLVKSFYSKAAERVNEDIVNPISYEEGEISHIPEEARVRSYGCGSPVLDCDLKQGEVLTDLGSGTGVECFIAAKKIGAEGKVYGIDMSDTMLGLAKKSLDKVAEKLGYINVEFKKGLLEDIPLKSETVDVVISNCVINLSPKKRRTFREISRILKPGGRICISDIVCDEEIPLDIKYNEKLRGECIGGAMKDNELFSMLEDLMFENIIVKKRFLYRQVRGYNFYSITYSAYKPKDLERKDIIYRGPFASIITDDGQIIRRGRRITLDLPSSFRLDDNFFTLDEKGDVANIDQKLSCACFVSPEKERAKTLKKPSTGCLVCGADILYFDRGEIKECYYCKRELRTNGICEKGHFICDKCHSEDVLEVIQEICLRAEYKDLVALLKRIRSHPIIPLHGPEHHSLVPAIILSVYKSLGGEITDTDIINGIERGNTIVGGSCSFLGICGAATGVGIAFSIILKANPYKGRERQLVQKITRDVLEKISSYKAPRCCQRDCWIALKATSELSKEYLSLFLPFDEELICTQYHVNKECIVKECPLFIESE